MSQKANHFWIGLFVIVGTMILIAGLIYLGVGKVFKEVAHVETCFDQSIQGLDVGSPIKFRGFKVGEVTEILIAGDEYPLAHSEENFHTYAQYLIIRGELDAEYFVKRLAGSESERHFGVLINEAGMRVKLEPLGITGLSYLEVAFMGPAATPLLEIPWTPRGIYVPSTSGTIQLLSQILAKLSGALDRDVFPMLERLNAASEDLPDVSRELKTTLGELNAMAADVRVATSDLPNLIAKAEQTMVLIDGLLENKEADVEEILENLRVVTGNLREVAGDLNAYPSRVIFGGAPEAKGVKR